MGGNVGLLVDDDGDASTPGVAQFAVYDAFGNEMAASAAGAGLRASFAWRGVEGSAHDAGSNLVYMQNRHYDPTIGRFIQADSVLLASVTTQGMNRYIYAENDPVNRSDPSGNSLWVTIGIIIAILTVIAALIKFFILLWKMSKVPKRCVTELDSALGDRQILEIAVEDLENSLPAGVSTQGPVGVPQQPADVAVDLIIRGIDAADD